MRTSARVSPRSLRVDCQRLAFARHAAAARALTMGAIAAGAIAAGTIAAGALLASSCRSPPHDGATRQLAGGSAERGVAAIGRYGCGGCHEIPDIPGADGLVGPPLTRWSCRVYIAGRLQNEPASLVQWIMRPQAFEPGSAMPNMGVSERDARDIAAYLYTLR